MQRKITKLAIFPDGPLAFDGRDYLYSEGEGIYIDRIASHFDEVILCSYAYRSEDTWYSSVSSYRFESTNIKVVELPLVRSEHPNVLQKLNQFLKVAWVIIINIRKWDVLYLFIPSFPTVIAYFINTIFRKPYFVYAASDWSLTESECMFRWGGLVKAILFPAYYRFNLWFEKQVIRKALFSLAAGKQCLERHRAWSDRVYETITRINWKDLKPFYREDTCQESVVNILCVGGFIPRKGIQYLIEAFAVARNEKGIINLRLNLVGDGELRPELVKLAQDLQVSDDVIFHGQIPNGPELFKIYQKCDLFVLPSLSEGFPRVLYEAMINNVPIVSTRVSGVPHVLVHEEGGLLVPAKDPHAIADAIQRLLDDRILRQKFIRNGQMFMQRFLQNCDGGKQVWDLLQKYLLPS